MTLLWHLASLPKDLEYGCVHVWAWTSTCSLAHLERCAALLSSEERRRMLRFHFKRDQVRFAVSHGSLRRILGSYLGLHPGDLDFHENHYGKPSLAVAAPKISFSLSHTDDIAILGVARGLEIGVDVEKVRPIEACIAEQYYSAAEQMELGKLSGADWLRGFYNCWTRKEAILKAEGVGLNVQLSAFDVSLAPGLPPQLLAHRAEANLSRDWQLTALQPSEDVQSALATSGRPAEMRCWRLAEDDFAH